MARESRTVTCPHCGAETTTRAFGGVALRCRADGCGKLFECPAKEPTGRRAKATSEPVAKPEVRDDQGGAGGVKVKRAKGVKATAPAPPADPSPADDDQDPPPGPVRTKRVRPKSHRRSWGRR